MMVSPASWCIRVRRQGRRSDGGMMSGREIADGGGKNHGAGDVLKD